jgi:hypothetical protein
VNYGVRQEYQKFCQQWLSGSGVDRPGRGGFVGESSRFDGSRVSQQGRSGVGSTPAGRGGIKGRLARIAVGSGQVGGVVVGGESDQRGGVGSGLDQHDEVGCFDRVTVGSTVTDQGAAWAERGQAKRKSGSVTARRGSGPASCDAQISQQ